MESNTVEINWNDFKELTDICLNVDVVIHTAGMNARDCENNPKDAMLFNGSRTGDFIRASKKAGVKKFIYLSTVHVYSPALTGYITEQSIAKNNALLKEIAIKETELQSRSEKVEQLEKMIQDQRQALNDLKETLSDALLNFQGKGLTVEQLNGKVYVSMENKLLFKSGKWNVEKQGIKALKQLANVLVDNPDISILIEGHTDNVPVNSKGDIKSNWDLSTKRATAVVEILLQNEQILPQNLTAAGRSEYLPIAPNSTFEGRAANRRIEIILSPSLDKITTILEKKN